MAREIDYGRDVGLVTQRGAVDIDPFFRLIRGPRVVLEAVLRRLMTPRGSLLSDPNYGQDVRGALHAEFDAAGRFALATAIANEARKDDRVTDARCSVDYNASTGRVRIQLACATGTGPFRLVLAVSKVGVEVLAAEV